MTREEGHTLVVLEKGVDYEIEHTPDCATEVYAAGLPGDGPVIEYVCLTGYLIGQAGLKDNGVDWEELDAGRYPLVATSGWSPSLPTNGGAEWEALLEIADQQ